MHAIARTLSNRAFGPLFISDLWVCGGMSRTEEMAVDRAVDRIVRRAEGRGDVGYKGVGD